MDGRKLSLHETAEHVYNRFWDTAIDEAVKDWANKQLVPIQTDLDLILRGREGYLDFLLTTIGREHEKFTATSVESVPYDDLREAPLCTCHDRCALSQGRVPGVVRNADSINRGIRRFKQDHSGDPLVLDHDGDPPGARQRWSQKRREVGYVLRRVETFLHHEREEPPDSGIMTVDDVDGLGTTRQPTAGD